MNKYSFLFKYIIIGDASVGKSCMLMQFLQNKFKYDSQTTVGVQFGSKTIEVHSDKVKLQIWDTAGQQIFKSITRSYYRGSIGAILVYDITNRQSFKNLQKWIDQTKNYANQKLSIILVGNKNDLQNKRQVTVQQGKRFGQQNHMLFLECSAKDTKSTEAVFQELAKEIIRKINSKEIDPRNQALGVKIGTFRPQYTQPTKGYSCC